MSRGSCSTACRLAVWSPGYIRGRPGRGGSILRPPHRFQCGHVGLWSQRPVVTCCILLVTLLYVRSRGFGITVTLYVHPGGENALGWFGHMVVESTIIKSTIHCSVRLLLYCFHLLCVERYSVLCI